MTSMGCEQASKVSRDFEDPEASNEPTQLPATHLNAKLPLNKKSSPHNKKMT